MTTTTKEMIDVMEAFDDGKPIEVAPRHTVNAGWGRTNAPMWNWVLFNYRVALTKPSWDWSHVSKGINFLVRQSPAFGGNGIGLAVRPEKVPGYWITPSGAIVSAKTFASYDPGTCDWRDSLVVRPGYAEDEE